MCHKDLAVGGKNGQQISGIPMNSNITGEKPAFITYDYHESTSAGRAACIPHAAARGSARQGAAALSEFGWQGGETEGQLPPMIGLMPSSPKPSPELLRLSKSRIPAPRPMAGEGSGGPSPSVGLLAWTRARRTAWTAVQRGRAYAISPPASPDPGSMVPTHNYLPRHWSIPFCASS